MGSQWDEEIRHIYVLLEHEYYKDVIKRSMDFRWAAGTGQSTATSEENCEMLFAKSVAYRMIGKPSLALDDLNLIVKIAADNSLSTLEIDRMTLSLQAIEVLGAGLLAEMGQIRKARTLLKESLFSTKASRDNLAYALVLVETAKLAGNYNKKKSLLKQAKQMLNPEQTKTIEKLFFLNRKKDSEILAIFKEPK